MSSIERFSLQGKTCVVTGGGRGLGQVIAEAFAEAGASAIALCSRRVENLEHVAAELERQYGTKTLVKACDVTDPAHIDAFAESVLEAFGAVDVLVNNSGRSWGADPLEIPIDKWDDVFDTNVRGTWLMTRAFGRQMIQRRKGSVINISSIAGQKGIPAQVLNALDYNASKAAVDGLTRDLAVKWAPYNVRVNAIAPGFFPSRMTQFIVEDPQYVARLSAFIPLGRLGEPEELKGIALLLASDAGSYITGQVIAVDGGQSAV
ncbi:MAG: glucose 1-dehydrogenase [Firmicutes bacterium]|nr:glucose 1-dehydrogenase [Bacillota bacterium]